MGGCEGYGALANFYDGLNREIDYSAWADFIEKCFKRYLNNGTNLVLDLACGTGKMTRELATRGYDMIGVDGSADMLSQAYSQSTENILYLCQDMRNFELYGTVSAVVCCLDSINYLLDEKDVRMTFSCVHNYLDTDGLFVFDVNSPYKFEHIYSDNSYVLEDEREDGSLVLCAWQNQYDSESKICDFYLSIFEERGDGSYVRSDEHQREKCYTLDKLVAILNDTGFELISVCSDFSFSEPCETTERYYIIARAKK